MKEEQANRQRGGECGLWMGLEQSLGNSTEEMGNSKMVYEQKQGTEREKPRVYGVPRLLGDLMRMC